MNVKPKKEYNKKTLYGTFINSKAIDKLNSATKRTKWAKEDLQSEKVKKKLNEETKSKSKHRIELEKEYAKKGMTKEESEIAAYKRERTEKIIAVTAGLAITAAAAYVAYKHYDKVVDKVIKSGTMLSRVTDDGTNAVHDAFYAAINKPDGKKYVGLYGSKLSESGKNDVFQKSVRINKNLKIASEKSAMKGFFELAKKDSSYSKTLQSELKNRLNSMDVLNSTEKQRKVVTNGLNSLSKGKIDKNVYGAFNINLIDHDSDVTKGFYKHMISKGYDAVMDLNDKKFSGYMAKSPVIVFNSSKATVDSVRKLGEQEIKKAYTSGAMDVVVKTLIPFSAAYGGGALGVRGGINIIKSKRNDAIVARYRKEHPNTELSYTEIVRNYRK